MKNDEQRIRELAYQIWESEGRPHGQADRHWEMARSLVEAESTAGSAPKPEDAPKKVPPRQRKPAREEPDKPAILQEPPRRKGKLPKADPETPAEAKAAKPKRSAKVVAEAPAAPGPATRRRPKIADE
ncbi:hypothetical protein D3C76_689950 [compost metagenome]